MAETPPNILVKPDPLFMLSEIIQVEDKALLKKVIPLSGKLNTFNDPAMIGTNFRTLKNLAPQGTHPKGIRGMTKINSAAITTYTKIKNLFHFRKEQKKVKTADLIASESHLLTVSLSSDEATQAISDNTTAIPATGNFSSALALYTGFSDGRISAAPNEAIVFCNGLYPRIWTGNESPVSAIINVDVGDSTKSWDFTEILKNTVDSTIDSYQNVTLNVSTDRLPATTKLLLHLDGNDGSTTITDYSASGHAMTANGDAALDTAQRRFGLSSLYKGYLTTPDSADFNFSATGANGIYSIELNILASGSDANAVLYHQQTDANNYIVLKFTAAGKIEFAYYSAGVAQVDLISTNTAISNYWCHVRVVQNGNGHYLFVNGNLEASATSATKPADYTGSLYIGADSSAGNVFQGWIDEFLITWTASSTASFTPVPAPYTDKNLVALLIGSTRTLDGIKPYIETANGVAAGVDISNWSNYGNGVPTWQPINYTTMTDGSASAGATLAQTGLIAFPDLLATASLHYFYNRYLYWYYVVFTNAISGAGISSSTKLYHFAVSDAIQALTDIWDGSERSIISCLRKNTSGIYNDYTLNVYSNNWDSADASTYMELHGLATSEKLLFGFTEQMTALNFYFVQAKVNDTPATNLSLSYYNGSSFTAKIVDDQTSVSSISFAKNGTTSWASAWPNQEFKVNLAGNNLFYYEVSFNQTLSGDASNNLWLYYVTGIPASKSLIGHSFSIHAMNRLLLCDNAREKRNAMIISALNSNCIFNGNDSYEVEFGDNTKLTAGCVIQSERGSNVYNMVLIFKDTEMWMLVEGMSANVVFYKYRVSDIIGCPAWETLKTINMPIDTPLGLNRNIAIWQANNGIYISDGRSPIPVHGPIKNYFDPRDSASIKPSWVGKSAAFIDYNNLRYHWLFASGTSATALNKEMILDLTSMEWFEADRGANDLQCGCSVTDTDGNSYTYGGLASGYVERLENTVAPTHAFDGVDIVHEFFLGDFPLNDDLSLETRVIHFFLIALSKTTTANSISLTHYIDGKSSGTAYTLSPLRTNYRIIEGVKNINSDPGIFHSFDVSLTTNDELIGFEPLAMVVFYEIVREHIAE